jgi:formate dehydrogenase major subunit
VAAAHHLKLLPGTNVAMVNALAHTIVTEGLVAEAYVAELRRSGLRAWREFVSRPENSPEAAEAITGVPAAEIRAAARLYASAAAPSTTAWASPSTARAPPP